MTDSELQLENERLRIQLQEANETLEAIRSGAVDAFVIDALDGTRVYTLEGADRPYRILVEKMQQGAVTISEDGAIAYCNLRFAEFLDIPHERIIGSDFIEYVKPEEKSRFEQMRNLALTGIAEGELELVRADQTSNPFFLTLNMLPPESGVAIGGLVTDLKAQKLHDKLNENFEELSISEAQLRQLANSIPQLAFTTAPNGDVDWYNTRWYEYSGTNFDQMKGWGWQSIHDPDFLPSVMKTWKKSLVTGLPFDLTFPLRGTDGTYRSFLTRIIPVRDSQNEIIRWFGTSTDISKEREAQEQLRAIAAQLSDADRRKDEFLATLAHELRNPLSPIKTATQLMQRVDDDIDELRSLSGVIDRQVIQMVRLIDDLLDVSRISRGKFTLRKELCALQEIVTSAIEAAEPFIAKSDQVFHVDVSSEPMYVLGDKTRLIQILVNLLNNAAKYTPASGEIWLTVERENDHAVLEVRDNGIGLSEDKLSAVFGLFEQVDVAKERGQSGLGIGLSLVKNLVELHDGEVSAHSEGLGLGCRFRIRIPLSEINFSQSSDSPAVTKRMTPARSLRILVVEDTRVIRFMMLRLLKFMGHEVAEAENGQQGFEQAMQFNPDVIFSDISMPVMNGHELAKRIRKTESLKEIQLIAITGYGQEADRANAIASGFNDHIVKPIDAGVLEDLLLKLAEGLN